MHGYKMFKRNHYIELDKKSKELLINDTINANSQSTFCVSNKKEEYQGFKMNCRSRRDISDSGMSFHCIT